MEEVLSRFPHLGEKIFQKLDSKSLIECKEANRTFKNFLKVEKSSYFRVIQWYTNCSESLMRKIVKKSGAAIIIVSILREIFGNFARRTKQNSKYLQNWVNTPLHLAADRSQLGAFQLIIEKIDIKNPINIISDEMHLTYTRRGKLYHFGWNGTTPLHLAAKNGNLSICKLIIEKVLDKNPTGEKKINGNVQSRMGQWTPLHLAAYNGHFSVCELIINHISEKNPGDQFGWTPLHSAAQNGHLRVCKLILSNLREKFTKDMFGITMDLSESLKLATQYHHEQIRTEILNFISDTKLRNSEFGEEKDENKKGPPDPKRPKMHDNF